MKKALWIRLVSEESHPVTTYTNHFDPVYKDSAIEVFFQFGPLGSTYMNFEFNANGAVLAMYGAEREGRSRLDDAMIQALNIRTDKTGDAWSITFFLPQEIIRSLYPDFTLTKGSTFSFNFYKISESEEIEHYGAMSDFLCKPHFMCRSFLPVLSLNNNHIVTNKTPTDYPHRRFAALLVSG